MRKVLTVLFLFVLVALVACGGGGSAPAKPAQPDQPAASGGATESEAAAPESVAKEPVSLRIWTHQNNAFNAAYQTQIDAYMAANPNVTITLETFDYDTYIQTLQTSLPAGTEADIIQMFGSWVCSYAEGGNLAEMPSSVISLADAEAQLFPAQIGGYICDGKLYGVPQEFNIEYGATLVNTAAADEVGLTDITAGWANWDEFIADAKALTITQDGVITRTGYHFTASDSLPATFYSLILQNGGQYLSDDGTFTVDTPEGQAALALMKRFVDEGIIDPVLFNDESNWVGESFFDGSSAMGLIGPWAVPEYSGDYPEMAAVTQYVDLPTVKGTQALVAASGWGLSVSQRSPAQDVAWDFVRFIALESAHAEEWNLASGTLPALRANGEGAAAEHLIAQFPHFGPWMGLLPYAQYEGAFPDRDLVWYEITYPRVLSFLQGTATADETLATLEREVRETFK